jgi:hypothetical protein
VTKNKDARRDLVRQALCQVSGQQRCADLIISHCDCGTVSGLSGGMRQVFSRTVDFSSVMLVKTTTGPLVLGNPRLHK